MHSIMIWCTKCTLISFSTYVKTDCCHGLGQVPQKNPDRAAVLRQTYMVCCTETFLHPDVLHGSAAR